MKVTIEFEDEFHKDVQTEAEHALNGRDLAYAISEFDGYLRGEDKMGHTPSPDEVRDQLRYHLDEKLCGIVFAP